MKPLFLDTEFTGLVQKAQLISLALLSADSDDYFYAEFTDYDKSQLSNWHKKYVLPFLKDGDQSLSLHKGTDDMVVVGDAQEVTEALTEWLSGQGDVEIWGDCPVWDWVLFCELFGGAFSIPSNIYYLPFDLVTLIKARGFDPDMDRRQFVDWPIKGAERPHHALEDARVVRACYQKIF